MLSFMIDEKITHVIVIRDNISMDNGTSTVFDTALGILTNKRVYSFAGGGPCSSEIILNAGNELHGFRKIKDIKADFKSMGANDIKVDRHLLFL